MKINPIAWTKSLWDNKLIIILLLPPAALAIYSFHDEGVLSSYVLKAYFVFMFISLITAIFAQIPFSPIKKIAEPLCGLSLLIWVGIFAFWVSCGLFYGLLLIPLSLFHSIFI